MAKKSNVEVSGALILSYLRSMINIKIFAGSELYEEINRYKVEQWYPLEVFDQLFILIEEKFDNSAPIKEKLGIESMNLWYNQGPGKEIIKRSVDFLYFQTSSKGFYSVVRGDQKEIGDFLLKSIDEQQGKAIIVSSTPFDKYMEKGVLIGGLKLVGDLNYVNVDNSNNPNIFYIDFH